MKKTFASLAVLVLALVGCPQTPPDPITSVDGLEGGRLVGDLQVDQLKMQTLQGGSIAVDNVNASGDGTFQGSIDASAITTASLNVAGPMTAASLSVDTASFVERPTLGGVPLASEIVGTALRANGPSTATVAEGSCAAAFDGAHICGESEFLQALPFFTQATSAIAGASVNVSSPRTVQRALDDVTERDLIANNCGNWTKIVDNEGGRFTGGGEDLGAGMTASPFAHGRVVVDTDDSGRVFLNFTVECAAPTIRFVCCH